MQLSQNKLALDIRLPARRITADTALRLSKYFGMSAEFWLGLQMDYDLEIEKDKSKDKIDKDVGTYKGSA